MNVLTEPLFLCPLLPFDSDTTVLHMASGTAGCFLDSFAREHLWAVGKDYIHGTGMSLPLLLSVVTLLHGEYDRS